MTAPLTTASLVESALEDAIRLLKRKRVVAPTLDERQRIDVEVTRLQAELALVTAQITAFLAKMGSLPSPAAADVAKIRANAERLDAVTAKNLSLSGVLKLINTAVDIWRT